MFFTRVIGFVGLNFGNEALNSGIEVHPGQSFSVGVPQNWNILKIWSISESPINKGLLS